MREAQLRKDIVQFMSVYSLTYPEVDNKRASTLKSWENFDFTNLVFTVDKVQSIDPDNAIAEVTWYMDTKNRRTQVLASSSQSFQVRFAKEQGKWRIRSLEEVEPAIGDIRTAATSSGRAAGDSSGAPALKKSPNRSRPQSSRHQFAILSLL